MLTHRINGHFKKELDLTHLEGRRVPVTKQVVQQCHVIGFASLFQVFTVGRASRPDDFTVAAHNIEQFDQTAVLGPNLFLFIFWEHDFSQ
jgi:hypothetical protein